MKYPFLILFVSVLITAFFMMLLARFALSEFAMLKLRRKRLVYGLTHGKRMDALHEHRLYDRD